MNLKSGALLQGGRYRIEKVLGQGGFGITYLGVQTSLDDKVAIKEFFMKDLCNRGVNTSNVSVGSVGSRELVEGFRKKFIKEARNIRRLKHRNIVPIIDVFEENGTAYYVMEYFECGNLKELVDNRGPLSEALAVTYISQLASALEKVHANGLLHLDIKPANVMLGNSGEAVLIDFGISKHYDEGGAQTSSGLVGTSEGYAPLEQYEAASLKTFTPATDIYALGATLFFLLTGTRPPKASEVMNLGLPELPANVSQNVRRAIETAMQPTVRMRPQSVRGFMELLDDMGKTEIVIDDVTVIDTPVVPEPQPEIKQEQKVKWMDFAEFKDMRKRFISWRRFRLILMCVIFSILYPFSPVLIVYFCIRLNISTIKDIENIESVFKLTRGKSGRLGLSKWGRKTASSLLRMKYDNISRINDEIFVCRRKGLYGVYNTTKKKMVVPVEFESIKLKGNRFHATKNGMVSLFTDKGYRIVE